jgi:hypothetical protein
LVAKVSSILKNAGADDDPIEQTENPEELALVAPLADQQPMEEER